MIITINNLIEKQSSFIIVKEFTIELSKTKPTFATLGYYSWDRAFDPNTDLKPQLEGIKTFYNEVKLSGLILKDVFKASTYMYLNGYG